MPPPHETREPSHLDRWLSRTHTITTYLRNICGTAWLLFICWVMWTQPDKLGPVRMIGGLALASITATCTVLWWMSNTMAFWRLDLITRSAAHSAADSAGLNGTRPHVVKTNR